MAATWTKTGNRSVRAVQAAPTESAPSLVTDGVNLTAIGCVVVVVYAPTSQTFSGTGDMLGYVWTGTLWVRADQADVNMSSYASLSAAALPALIIQSPRERFALVPVGVGLSGGTEITSDYFCTSRRSGMAL